MRSDIKHLAALLVGGALVAGCGGTRARGSAADDTASAAAYTDITAEQLHQMMDAKDFVLVNVHIPYAGDIPGTDLSIPYNQIVEQSGRLPTDKGAKIVLYCRSGHMSTTASESLVALGYTHVFNVTGGMRAWQAAGYSLEGVAGSP